MCYNPIYSYLSPKLEGRLRADGERGIFAVLPVKAGELLSVWGGRIVSTEELDSYPLKVRADTIEVEQDLWLICLNDEPSMWINHSCQPNAGLNGQIALVAMRDIASDEEICFDYAMTDCSPYYEDEKFECTCGAPDCRGQVTENDWKLPELQARYAGYFSLYLQRKIDQLRENKTVSKE